MASTRYLERRVVRNCHPSKRRLEPGLGIGLASFAAAAAVAVAASSMGSYPSDPFRPSVPSRPYPYSRHSPLGIPFVEDNPSSIGCWGKEVVQRKGCRQMAVEQRA